MKYKITYKCEHTVFTDSSVYDEEDISLADVTEIEDENACEVLADAISDGDVDIYVTVEEVKD